MTWPAPDLRIDFQNATVSADTHPAAHNDTNLSLNDDYRPEIIRIGNELLTLQGQVIAPRMVKNQSAGSGNFVKADYPNLVWFRVMMAGGGGGGGGAGATAASEGAAAGGGGGSGYLESYVTDLDALAASEPFTVGAGGAGGPAGNNNGADGTASTFLGLTASPGSGGTGQASVPFDFIAGLPGSGGATSGSPRAAFVNGSPGTAGTGSGQRNYGGAGGISHFGQPGAGGNAILNFGGGGGNGNRGAGGGGGANRPSQNARSGGNGGDGFIWFELWEIDG